MGRPELGPAVAGGSLRGTLTSRVVWMMGGGGFDGIE